MYRLLGDVTLCRLFVHLGTNVHTADAVAKGPYPLRKRNNFYAT